MWKALWCAVIGLFIVALIVGNANGGNGSEAPVPSSMITVEEVNEVKSNVLDDDFTDEDGWCAVLRHLEGYTRTFPVKRGESIIVDSGVAILAGLNAAGLTGQARQDVCQASVESYMDDHQPWVMLID